MRYPVSLEPAGAAGAAAAATASALGSKPAGSALGSVHRRALDMSIVTAGNRPVRAATWSRIHGSCLNSIGPGQTVWPVWRWPAMFGNVRCSPKIEMYSSALSGSTWWSDAFQETSWMRLAERGRGRLALREVADEDDAAAAGVDAERMGADDAEAAAVLAVVALARRVLPRPPSLVDGAPVVDGEVVPDVGEAPADDVVAVHVPHHLRPGSSGCWRCPCGG